MLATVLEEMPSFPERESSILAVLKKKKPGRVPENEIRESKSPMPGAGGASSVGNTNGGSGHHGHHNGGAASGVGAGAGGGVTDLLGLSTPTTGNNGTSSQLIDVLGDIYSTTTNNAKK